MKKESTESAFNLIQEKWIPVRTLDGHLSEISLREALLQADKFRAIEDGSPLVTISLYRLLLAILHRALEGPSDTAEATHWYKEGFPTEKIDAYLKKWYTRFDLFHPEHPFYQITGFPDSDFSYWTVLGAQYSSKHNKLLFDHSFDCSAKECPADAAARLLLAFQTFALGGGKSSFGLNNYTNAPSASAALILPEATTLGKTLSLGLVSYPAEVRRIDLPVWEKEPTSLRTLKTGATRSCHGVTELYTWIARAILLRPTGVAPKLMVRHLSLGSGFAMDSATSMLDPMIAWRLADGQYKPIGMRQDRAFWRDFSTIVPTASSQTAKAPLLVQGATRVLDGASPVQIAVFGIVNDKAKILEWRHEHYALPRTIAANEDAYGIIHTAIETADESQKALNRAVWNLATGLLTQGERTPEKADIEKLRNGFSHNLIYWPHMERAFHRLLAALKPDYSEEGVINFWKREQIEALQKAWGAVELSVGDDARALRALSKASGAVLARIRALKEESEGVNAE